MAFDEDLSLFFGDEGFATHATLADGRQFAGIYDRAYLDSLTVDTVTPVFLCSTDSLWGVSRGDILEIDGADYYIAKMEPDGTGLTNIILEAR